MLVLCVSGCSAALCCAVPRARSSHTTPTSRGLGAGRPGKEQAHGLVRFLHSRDSRQSGKTGKTTRQTDRHRQARPGKAAFPIPDIKTIINLVCPSIIHLLYLPIPIPSQPMHAASFPTHTPPSRFLSILTTSTLPALPACPDYLLLLYSPRPCLLTYLPCLPLEHPTNQP